jgi:hypothetical protein
MEKRGKDTSVINVLTVAKPFLNILRLFTITAISVRLKSILFFNLTPKAVAFEE